MVTGCYPYAGRGANAVYYAQVNEIPQRPDQINPDIPSTVSDIIMKLIEKLPDHRYQNGSQILQDISNVKSGIPLSPFSQDITGVATQPLTINEDSLGHQSNDVTEADDDLPTVVNMSAKDRDQLLSMGHTETESKESGKKSKKNQFPPLGFAIVGGGLILCLIIGYVLLNNFSPKNEIIPDREKEPVTFSSKSNSVDDRQTSESTPPLPAIKDETKAEPPQEETKTEESESLHKKPIPEPAKEPVTELVSIETVEKPSLNSIIEQLNAIKKSQEAEFVQIRTRKNAYKIGDTIEYHLQSNLDCHLLVFLISTSNEIVQVFPNQYHRDSFVSNGDIYDIPSPNMGINLEATGPPGIEELFAIISDEPIKVFPNATMEIPFPNIDGTDDSLLREVYENLRLATEMDVKHKSIKYAIAK
jgi:serine/threonine protein kinase